MIVEICGVDGLTAAETSFNNADELLEYLAQQADFTYKIYRNKESGNWVIEFND